VAAVKERVSYGESRYSETSSSLKVFSVEELKVKQGTWHRKCYQDATHSGMLKRANERYERALAGPNESRRKTRNLQEAEPINQLTRSKTTPYNKAVCFFCDGEGCNREKLKEVRTMNAGTSLREAIELSRNDKLHVKFSTAINATDAHEIDIKYHKNCWTKNVSNVLHKPLASSSSTQGKVSIVDCMAALQSLDKPTWITTCSPLAKHYMNQALQLSAVKVTKSM